MRKIFEELKKYQEFRNDPGETVLKAKLFFGSDVLEEIGKNLNNFNIYFDGSQFMYIKRAAKKKIEEANEEAFKELAGMADFLRVEKLEYDGQKDEYKITYLDNEDNLRVVRIDGKLFEKTKRIKLEEK